MQPFHSYREEALFKSVGVDTLSLPEERLVKRDCPGCAGLSRSPRGMAMGSQQLPEQIKAVQMLFNKMSKTLGSFRSEQKKKKEWTEEKGVNRRRSEQKLMVLKPVDTVPDSANRTNLILAAPLVTKKKSGWCYHILKKNYGNIVLK